MLEALGLINGYESLPPHTPGLAPWVVDSFLFVDCGLCRNIKLFKYCTECAVDYAGDIQNVPPYVYGEITTASGECKIRFGDKGFSEKVSVISCFSDDGVNILLIFFLLVIISL